VLGIEADRGADLVRAVGDALLRPGLLQQLGPEASGRVTVPTARADRVGRDQHPRSGHLACVDRVPEAHVDEVARADVAHGGEAGQQGATCVLGRDDRLLGNGLLQRVQLVLLPVQAGLEAQVSVGIHEAGQQGRIAEVDDPRAGRHLGARARGDDLAVGDDHDAGGHHGVGLAVVETRGAEDGGWLGGGRGERQPRMSRVTGGEKRSRRMLPSLHLHASSAWGSCEWPFIGR
jgi:hypothetical protein